MTRTEAFEPTPGPYPILTGPPGYRVSWLPGRSFRTFAEAIDSAPHDRPLLLDRVALIELATKGYAFADRTTVQGITREPFLAGTAGQELPTHSLGAEPLNGESAARLLMQRLEEELVAGLEGRSKVGLLLSGGMDSRIVAGVIERLRSSGRIDNEIVAVTWGVENSRDVRYASMVADELEWEWRFIRLNEATVTRNLRVASLAGAEISPIHLHALPDLSGMVDIDIVLAGSYGDMVGRAEFSGRHVSKLKSHDGPLLDPFGIFPALLTNEVRVEVRRDARTYRRIAGAREQWQHREIEHHAHYTRRLLQTAMWIGLNGKDLYQAFTSPRTYGLMWSLPAQARGNQHYSHILGWLQPSLRTIPWARTGRPYVADLPQVAPDTLNRRSHRYGEWIRRQRDDLRDIILGGKAFGARPIRRPIEGFLREWNRSGANGHTRMDELVVWLAALASAVEYHMLEPLSSEHLSRLKHPRRLRGQLYASAYRRAKDRSG